MYKIKFKKNYHTLVKINLHIEVFPHRFISDNIKINQRNFH